MTRPTTARPVQKPTGACEMTPFRQFVMDKWLEHKEELMTWERQLPEYDAEYYFNKHKWFLKNIYKLEVDKHCK